MRSLRSNWRGARREGGSVSAAILDRLSNEAPGPFQRNPKGGMSFGRRRCCSLLTDPLRDMLWCPCGSTSRLASAQNPLPRMYSYFGDTTLEYLFNWLPGPLERPIFPGLTGKTAKKRPKSISPLTRPNETPTSNPTRQPQPTGSSQQLCTNDFVVR